MRKFLLFLIVIFGLLAGTAISNAQESPSFTVSVNISYINQSVVEHQPYNQPAPSEFVGKTCSVSALSNNDTSTHLGNNLSIRAGNPWLTLSNFESEPNEVTQANGSTTLGNNISIVLILGQDMTSSAKVVINFYCEDEKIIETPVATPEATPTETVTDCIVTDLKGVLHYTGNHMSGNPISGDLTNLATNSNCPTAAYAHIFGSNIAPESSGWLESQSYVGTVSFTVPPGTIGMPISITVPDAGFCWYQVDLVRTSQVRVPPYYAGDDMIDYVFYQQSANCGGTPTETPIPEPPGETPPSVTVIVEPVVIPVPTPAPVVAREQICYRDIITTTQSKPTGFSQNLARVESGVAVPFTDSGSNRNSEVVNCWWSVFIRNGNESWLVSNDGTLANRIETPIEHADPSAGYEYIDVIDVASDGNGWVALVEEETGNIIISDPYLETGRGYVRWVHPVSATDVTMARGVDGMPVIAYIENGELYIARADGSMFVRTDVTSIRPFGGLSITDDGRYITYDRGTRNQPAYYIYDVIEGQSNLVASNSRFLVTSPFAESYFYSGIRAVSNESLSLFWAQLESQTPKLEVERLVVVPDELSISIFGLELVAQTEFFSHPDWWTSHNRVESIDTFFYASRHNEVERYQRDE